MHRENIKASMQAVRTTKAIPMVYASEYMAASMVVLRTPKAIPTVYASEYLTVTAAQWI